MPVLLKLIDRKRFRELFPHLLDEIENGGSKIKLDDYRLNFKNEDRLSGRKWAGYNPDVKDFLRRCKTRSEAEEIISFMEDSGEITTENAAQLRRQLRDEGLKSFGERKKPEFYHRKS